MPRAALALVLAAHHRRRRLWIVARGLLLSALGALALTLAVIPVAHGLGFERGAVAALGAAFYLGLAGVGFWALALPLRRQTTRRSASALEGALPALDGRLATYVERSEGPAGLLDLLAEDTLERLQPFPPDALLTPLRLRLTFGAGAAALLVLLALGAAPSGNLGSAARRLWTLGIGAALPRLSVEPGDASVQRGVELTLRARAESFEPSSVRIDVQFDGAAAVESATLQPDGANGFALRLAAVDRPFTYTVSAGRVASGPHRIQVLDPPRIEAARLRYVYPAWAHREPLVVDAAEDVAALAGTRVELELTTDSALEAGALVVDGEEQALELDGRRARGALSVKRSGSYHIAARLQGQPVRLTRDFAIEVLPDQPPSLEIAKPGRDRRATAIEEVSVGVRARDDIHLDAVELHYSINGGKWRTRALPSKGSSSDVEHVFALETLQEAALVPGDVIAYYGRARDHAQSAQTDLYFVEVRPFDRRYTQSQQGGGAGGGDGAGDISQRQRQILVATWNLVQDPGGEAARALPEFAERAALLARLQDTLLTQARALVERLDARGMPRDDESASGFLADVESAAGFMEQAVERLRARELDTAIEPEQRALQGLLRAEASLRELQISMQADGQGGGGGGADLEELIALEMDPSKNQYEVGSSQSSSPKDPAQQDELRKLEELARRQQALAEELERTQQPTLAQRWRQETLRRELEELQRSLAGQPASRELTRQLDTALREMGGSQAQPADRERASAASQSLERALRAAQEQRRDRLQGDVAELARRARELSAGEQESAARLQAAVDRGVGYMEDDRPPSEEEGQLADEYTELRREVDAMQRDAGALAERLRESDADLAARLERAGAELEGADVAEALSRSASLIRRGAAAFASGEENQAALRSFREATRGVEERSRGLSASADASRGDRTLERLAELRRALQRPVERRAAPPQRSEDPQTGWGPAASWTDLDPASARALSAALNEAGRSAPEISRQLAVGGSPARTLRALGNGASPSDRDLAERAREAIAELDQLELDLRARRGARVPASQSADSVPSSSEGPEVAEYFRRLSRDAPDSVRSR